MNIKRFITSIVLGIILSTILFMVLITINLSSIDYTNFTTEKIFKVLGQTYLKAKMVDGELVKSIISGPIAISGMFFSALVYGLWPYFVKMYLNKDNPKKTNE